MALGFKQILRGDFLVRGSALDNWRFILFCTLLAIIMIASSHSADRKVHEIEQLSEARQELEAEYTETKEKLTDLSLESKVLRKAKELGLNAPTERPDKIVVEE